MRAPKAPTAGASVKSSTGAQPETESTHAYCPELAAHAQVLGITLIEPTPLSEAQQAEAEQLAAAVVEADASER